MNPELNEFGKNEETLPALIINPENLHIINFNNSARELLGLKDNANKNASDLFPGQIELFKRFRNGFYNISLKKAKAAEVLLTFQNIDYLGSNAVLMMMKILSESDKAELLISEKIFHYSGVGVIVFDRSTDEIIFFNPVAIKQLRYSRREMSQLNVKNIFPREEDYDNTIKKFDRDKDQKCYFYEDAIFIRSDGSEIFLDYYIIRKGHEEYILALTSLKWNKKRRRDTEKVIRYIKSGKEILYELRKSEKRYRELLEFLPVVAGVQQEGRIVYINRTGREEWGDDRKDKIINKSLDEIIHPESKEILKRRLERLYKGEDLPKIELKIIKGDGKLMYFESKARLIQYKGSPAIQFVGYDISERIRSEQKIRKNEEEYRNLIEQSFDGIALLTRMGEIKVYNERFIEILGYRRGEIKKTILRQTYYTEFTEWIRQLDLEKNKGRELHFESSMRRRGGEEFFAEINMRIVDEGMIMLVIRDISEKRAAEQIQEDLLNRLIEAQKVTNRLSKRILEIQENERRYIARELHDEVGQNLTALKIDLITSVQYIRSNKIKEQLKESINIVNTLLKNVRDMSLNLRPSILDDLGLLPAVRWFADKQSQRSGINGKVISNFDKTKLSEDVEVTAYRIIQEAVNNIIKHSDAKNFTVELENLGEELIITITDDGKGYKIEEALQRASKGKSLGLMNMKERAELVGGWLRIYSVIDKGTKIISKIPILADRSNKEENE